MEAPDKRDQTLKEIRSLLIQLGKLPEGPRIQILSQFDPYVLGTICDELSEKEDLEVGNLASYCGDPNFWRDMALARGYDLPETLLRIIDQMRLGSDDSQVATIRILFFGDADQYINLRETFINNTYPSLKPEDIAPELSEEDRQLILDFEYLTNQIEAKIDKQSRNLPKIHLTRVRGPRLNANQFLQNTTYLELLQFLVDQNQNIIGTSEPYWFINFRHNQKLNDDWSEQQITTQNLYFKNGDLLTIFLTWDTRVIYYINGEDDQQRLILVKRDTNRDSLLPAEAAKFVAEHKIQTPFMLNRLYNLQMGPNAINLRGFYDSKGDYYLSENLNKVHPVEIGGVEFSVSD